MNADAAASPLKSASNSEFSARRITSCRGAGECQSRWADILLMSQDDDKFHSHVESVTGSPITVVGRGRSVFRLLDRWRDRKDLLVGQ